jgi:hypothetical protein
MSMILERSCKEGRRWVGNGKGERCNKVLAHRRHRRTGRFVDIDGDLEFVPGPRWTGWDIA